MHSDVGVTVAGGVVLVTVTFDNTEPVAQRVRLENRLDGPVLPPRRRGVPEPGWDDDGFEGVVPADATVALGYACPTADSSTLSPDIDPDAVVAVDVLGRDTDEEASVVSPTDAIRQLGPSRPPADAVPAVELPLEPSETLSDADESSSEADDSPPDGAGSPVETTDSPPEPTDADVAVAFTDAVESPPTTESTRPAASSHTSTSRPSTDSGCSSFLVAAERRVELAERLDSASVSEAADALESSDATVDAVDALESDRARLRRLAAWATELADRAADANPDVDALRRVA